MKALRVHENGEPADVLRLEEVATPRPGPGQVLVRVRAAAVNFPDALLCRGMYQTRPPLPFTPGVELCGEVAEAGEGVTGIEPGARVLGGADLPAGAFADYALMSADGVFPAPDSLGDDEAASLYIGYQTGWFALHRRAGLRPGETVLVHAAAGGVGSAAVQLAKAAGARVVGVVGGPEKAKTAAALGADVVVDRHAEDFVAVVKELTGGRGADVVFDPVGGESYARSTKCVAFEGRIVVIGFASGTIPTPGLNHALIKNYSILGLHWGLYRQRAPETVAEAHARLTELADRGLVKPLVSERLGAEGLAAGVQRLADGDTVGRLVFTP
ncbi:NADPH:quinone oxidoreductase family protein [Streptomonospora nanhaiensis]|uniref:NADPH2:quinone reductase n=1 Tax=Streptomonospora nanhaiensis TaxID=1323731 RepID=A0A853BP98_9ACTN|nr:NADPH:quinone oxidoreductase family protein [Streptomonospora nanhaiensis]MBV2361917.1 NADPH:quinone oxidoreductase family protein [Streptomonospora nanhaiensis]MBX9388627.1 NADPH:quinone oxidoreductase family protein [Streptomonospora nanhaiensis]NYI96262.1 NADPH2:quinone reductase [Streptomonospora nanhaiensis]